MVEERCAAELGCCMPVLRIVNSAEGFNTGYSLVRMMSVLLWEKREAKIKDGRERLV